MAENELHVIKKALGKTGFPFEQEIFNILRKRDYESQGSQFFEDSGKTREIDVEAGIPIKPPHSEYEWFVNPQIAIECKKSETRCWIFYKSDTTVGHFDIAHGIDAIARKAGYNHLGIVFEGLHYTKRDVASSFSIVDLGKGRISPRDDIFDAMIKLTRFVNYRLKGLKEFFDDDRRDIVFYFPVIVFDGKIYEAYFEAGMLSVWPINAIVLETRIVSSVTGKLSPMYIDVVTKSEFENLLSLIEAEVRVANNNLRGPKTRTMMNQTLEKRRP